MVLDKPVIIRYYWYKKVYRRDLLSVVTEYGAEPARVIVSDESFVDSDDVVFYEVAMGLEGSYLVTGNIKHFPRRPFVVTPTQMVEILQSRDLL